MKPFTKKDIQINQYVNRYIIRNADHIGLYHYIDGYMLLINNLSTYVHKIEGVDLVHKVYDTYEDRNKETLLRYSEVLEPTGTIQDLMMVSEVYQIPRYIRLTDKQDMEDMNTALLSDEDFHIKLRELVTSR